MSGVGEGKSKLYKSKDYGDNFDAIFRKKKKKEENTVCRGCGDEYTELEVQKFIDCTNCGVEL